MVGVDKIHKWATLLGLGDKTGIDLPNEIEGLVPSTEWKRRRTNEKWYAGETISVSIGQGQVSLTPVSHGRHDVDGRQRRHTVHPASRSRRLTKATAGSPSSPLRRIAGATEAGNDCRACTMASIWWSTALAPAARARIPGKDVSGKTGTAQVISLQGGKKRAGRTERDLRDHGWFVFFAPRDNPEIAGVIFGEHNEHGATSAPVAKYIMETYFNKKEGKPLPKLAMPAPDRCRSPTSRPRRSRPDRRRSASSGARASAGCPAERRAKSARRR